MNRRQRQRELLQLVREAGEMELAEVCARLGMSEATVRRDFAQLTAEGKLERFWGGVRFPPGPGLSEGPPAFAERQQREAEAKRAIARQAASMVRDGEVLFIDGGTTTLHLCEFLAGKRIRVITNSVIVGLTMERLRGNQSGAEVILAGGRLEPDSWLVTGPATEAFLGGYRADWMFFSAAGVDGGFVTNYDEAVLNSERIMLKRSARPVLLVDATKLNRQAMRELCPVSRLSQLITTAPARNPALSTIRRQGVEVVRVPAE